MVRDAPMGVLHGSRDTTGRKQSPQSHGAHSEEGKMPLHFTPHCLRHTYASLMLQQGEPVTYVQRQLGHASIQLTVDTYGKWLPMGNKAAVDRLDAVASDESGSKMVATAGAVVEDHSNDLILWSRRLESNQRPAVYETAALPTELRRRWMTAKTKAGTERRYDSQEIAGVSIVV